MKWIEFYLYEKKEIETSYPDSFTSLIEYLKDVA